MFRHAFPGLPRRIRGSGARTLLGLQLRVCPQPNECASWTRHIIRISLIVFVLHRFHRTLMQLRRVIHVSSIRFCAPCRATRQRLEKMYLLRVVAPYWLYIVGRFPNYLRTRQFWPHPSGTKASVGRGPSWPN